MGGVDNPWVKFSLFTIIAAAIMMAAVVGVVVVLDPYGRMGFRGTRQVPDLGAQFLKVPRGRDTRFDSAIIGNSTVEIVSPERLSTRTGLRFVQLAISGTQTLVHLQILQYFLDHHRLPKAVVIAVDDSGCYQHGPQLIEQHPFPFWLYGNTAQYLIGLVSLSPFKALYELYWLHHVDADSVDGFDDYTRRFVANNAADENAVKRYPPNRRTSAPGPKTFTAAVRLGEALKRVPAETRVVVYRTPLYVDFRPALGSEREKWWEACAAAYREVTEKRENSVFLDWSDDRPEARDPLNFFDAVHMRRRLAELIENDIAAVVR